jgi:deoxyribose-phosphate aldolase
MSHDVTLVTVATVSRLEAGAVLEVEEPYMVTPSAAELAAQKRIRIQTHGHSDPLLSAPANRCAPYKPRNAHDQLDYARELASYIDSTLLLPHATAQHITELCREAALLRFASVCVNPLWVMTAADALDSSGPVVTSVCGFPLGAQQTAIKAAEAHLAETQGAREIDMVLPLGKLKSGHWKCVQDDIAGVRKALSSPDVILKVIIEAPLLTDEEKVTASVIAVESGADFVKTGTGFHGPACAADVALIRSAIGNRAKIKAAGGIRTCSTASDLIDAGANRLGTSHAAELIRDCQPDGS